MEIARAEVRLTDRDERAFAKYLQDKLMRNPARIILTSSLYALPVPAVLLLVSIRPGIGWLDVALMAVGWAIAAVFIAFARLAKNRIAIQNTKNRSGQIISFFENHYTVVSPDNMERLLRKVPYDDFVEVIERDNEIYIVDSTKSYLIIPNRCVQGCTPKQLAEFLNQALKNGVIHINIANFKIEMGELMAKAGSQLDLLGPSQKKRRALIRIASSTIVEEIVTPILSILALMLFLDSILHGIARDYEAGMMLGWLCIFFTSLFNLLSRDSIAQNKEKTTWLIVDFLDTAFSVRSDSPDRKYNRSYPYDKYVHAIERPNAFCLHAGSGKDFVIPKRSLTQGTVEGISKLLKEKLGPNFTVSAT